VTASKIVDALTITPPIHLRRHFRSAVILVFPVIAAVAYAYGLKPLMQPEVRDVYGYLSSLAAVVAVSCLAWGLRYDFMPLPCRITVRSLSVLFSGFFAAYGAAAAPVSESAQAVDFLLVWLRVGAILLGAISLYRPSFFLPILFLIFWQSGIMQTIRLIGTSSTDIKIVFEFASTLILGMLILYAADRAARILRLKRSIPVAEAANFLLLALTAVHFSNYFYSGIQKIILDGGPLSWITENRTTYLALAATKTGHLPLTFPEGWHDVFLRIIHTEPVNWATNATVLITQLLSVVAVFSVGLMIAFCLIYDAQHIGIFAFSGLFFYKWIWLNTTLAIALRHVKDDIDWPRRIALVIYLLCAPYLFSIAWLGWYDTGSFTRAHFVAETDDGRQVRIPTNYFLGASIRFGQGDFAHHAAPGFPTWSYGATMHYDIMKRGGECALPIVSRPAEAYIGELKSFMALHHRWMLQNVDHNGRLLYDLYPHHAWSNPFQFTDFYRLDKRRIRRYRISIISECLSVDEAGLRADQRASHDVVIELQN
jgi:hypothetical protein